MSELIDLMMKPWFARNYEECAKILDAASPGRDPETRASIASWRSTLLERAGDFAGALKLLDVAAPDFACQTSVALRRACDLEVLGRRPEALAALRAAPITQEYGQFPAICKEADFFLCLFMARNGETPPQALLDAIPDDHFGFDPAQEMVTKKDILDATAAHAGRR